MPLPANRVRRPSIIGGHAVMSRAVTRTYLAIVLHVQRHGYPPTVREIATATAVCVAAVQGCLKRLVRDGLVTVEPNTARGIVPVHNSYLPASTSDAASPSREEFPCPM